MKQLVCLMTFFVGLQLNAQNNSLGEKTFTAYSEYLLSEYGISCKIPSAFINTDKYNVSVKIRKDKDKHIGNCYGLTLISKDKQCMVLYSAFPHQVLQGESEEGIAPVFPRSQIIAELKTALGEYYHPHHPKNINSAEFNFNKFVTVVSGNRAIQMFNADSIYIYDIPGGDSVYFFNEALEKKRKNKYPYCSSLFISKKGRVGMDLKFFFTKRGKKNERKYFEELNKQIWYEEGLKQY